MTKPNPTSPTTAVDRSELEVLNAGIKEIRAIQQEWVAQQAHVLDKIEELYVLIDSELAELHANKPVPDSTETQPDKDTPND